MLKLTKVLCLGENKLIIKIALNLQSKNVENEPLVYIRSYTCIL